MQLRIDDSISGHCNISVVRRSTTRFTLISRRTKLTAVASLVAHVNRVHGINARTEDVVFDHEVIGRIIAGDKVAYLNNVAMLEVCGRFELADVITLNQEITNAGKVDGIILNTREHTADKLTVADATEAATDGDLGEGDIWGLYAQVGYNLDKEWGLGVRFGHFEPDSDLSDIKDQEEFNFVVNYYLNGHDLKLQNGVTWEMTNFDSDDVTDFRYEMQLNGYF